MEPLVMYFFPAQYYFLCFRLVKKMYIGFSNNKASHAGV